MTDNEIIQANQQCSKIPQECDCCPYYNKIDCVNLMTKDTIDLINRQKAENEELISKLDELESEYTFYKISAEEQIEALIAGQETLQKYIAKKDKEIDMLKRNIEILAICKKDLPQITTNAIKTEAVKEFAEKVKGLFNPDVAYDISREIDSLVKEMVGETE